MSGIGPNTGHPCPVSTMTPDTHVRYLRLVHSFGSPSGQGLFEAFL